MQEQADRARLGGSIAVVVSAMLFGAMPLFAKVVYANGGNSVSVVFYRVFFALFPALLYLLRKGISLAISRREALQILLLAVCGYGGTAYLLFLSYNFVPSGMATTLHFVYPVLVILGSILFLREKAGARRLVCVGLCMAGILLFYNGESGGSPLGVLIALSSGVTYSFYILYLGHSSLRRMHPIKLIFYMNVFCSALMGGIGLATGQLTAALTPLGWGSMLILSVVISFSAVLLFQTGVRTTGPQNTAILSTFEPITSLILGALIFHEHLGFRSLLGCALILAAVILVARAQRPPCPAEDAN